MRLIIAMHLCFVLITANMRCSNESPLLPNYYLIEKCYRSKLAVLARATYASLSSCQRLGIEKKALAFNFSPPEAINFTNGELEYTCEVLKCAEVSGGLSLNNDSRFDYYSVYANPIPDINSACVPATGMFYLLQRRFNYTQAAAECKNMNGMLAAVTSEQRTDTLAQFIAAANLDTAYVGMRRQNSTKFYNPNGDSLECSTYRAWAPGHPRKQYKRYDCAVLTRHRTWRSTACKDKYSALCELIPGGPYKKGSLFPTEKDDINQSTRLPIQIDLN